MHNQWAKRERTARSQIELRAQHLSCAECSWRRRNRIPKFASEEATMKRVHLGAAVVCLLTAIACSQAYALDLDRMPRTTAFLEEAPGEAARQMATLAKQLQATNQSGHSKDRRVYVDENWRTHLGGCEFRRFLNSLYYQP
jgi:hypothetical protein